MDDILTYININLHSHNAPIYFDDPYPTIQMHYPYERIRLFCAIQEVHDIEVKHSKHLKLHA